MKQQSLMYLESYIVLGCEIGIEDRNQPGHHFMSDDKSRARFAVWAGGCGIGQEPTLQAARKRAADYARVRAEELLQRGIDSIVSASAALKMLKDGRDPLGNFKQTT